MLSLFQKHTRTIKNFLGKIVDVDKRYANQCVDWVKKYAIEIGYPITTFGNAKDFARIWLWENWIPTKTIAPWHIVVFNRWTYGHIAVVDKASWNRLYTVDQNSNNMAYKNNNENNLGSPIMVNTYVINGSETFFKVKN